MSMYINVLLEAQSDFDLGIGFPMTEFERLLDLMEPGAGPDAFFSKACQSEEDAAIDPADDCWFTPDEGLAWSTKVRATLAPRTDDPETDRSVGECLDEFEANMRHAKSIGSRWNFFVF